MKKTYIALAVLALAALVSCQQEIDFNFDSPGKGEVGFYLRGAKATKASSLPVSVLGETFELGVNENGTKLFLEETISNLNLSEPETKGTPAYTENVVALYDAKFQSAVYSSAGLIEKGGEFAYDGSKFYTRKYDGNMWKSRPLTFYMWMPSNLNTAVTNGINGLTFDDGTIAFSYDGSKLTTADKMQDLLFTSRTFTGLSTDDEPGDSPYNEETGADILFHHALTGVKFAVDPASGTSVKIIDVTFSGLFDKGDCLITPRKEDQEEGDSAYNDNPTGDYSSGDDVTVVWSKLGKASPAKTYSLGDDYNGTPFSFSTGEGHFGEDSNNKYPASFSAAGNENNLNDSEATFTFWFIPQTITENVKLTISYTVGTNTEPIYWEIPFGTVLAAKNVIWRAGELRTYTIKVDDVNVSITDQFTKSIKNNVVITNTGNTDAYIRAAIIGQWVDKDKQPVFGYTNYKLDVPEPVEIESWYQDYMNGNKYFGTFHGLAGYADGGTAATDNPTGANPFNKWFFNAADGFYYYTEPVPVGASPAALFISYVVNTANTPTMLVGGVDTPTDLLIEISTQAISAKSLDGSIAFKNEGTPTTYDYMGAWANAKTIASNSQNVTTTSNQN